MKNKKDVDDIEIVQTTFTKDQILQSKRYSHSQDVVNVVLKDDEAYTLDQVNGLIEEFMKGEVN